MGKRSYRYTPELCKDGPFNGYVVMTMPKYSERKKLIKKYGIKANATGQVDFEVDAIESLSAMVDGVKEYVEEVKIKRVHDKKEYVSFEDLEYDPSCDALLEDLGRLLIQGETLEKK